MKVHLVVLIGVDDLEIKFLNQETWNEIEATLARHTYVGYTEEWNDAVLKELAPAHIGYKPDYGSVKEAIEAFNKTDDEIIEEHFGVIY